MILAARLDARLPESPASDRGTPPGFDALLDASESTARIALPAPPRPVVAARDEAPPKRDAGERERSGSEEPEAESTAGGLLLLDFPAPDRTDRPRLFKGDNPAPAAGRRALGGVQQTLVDMDVRLAVTRLTAAEASTRMVTPMPADPIRDLGEVFELPRPEERASEPTAGRTPSEPETAGIGAPEREDAADASGQDGGSQPQGDSPQDAPALTHAAFTTPASTGFTLLPAEVASSAMALEPGLAADRAAAASMLMDAQAGVADGITVHLDDVLGRWEVDVLRRGNELGLVLRGDANLHDAVRQAAGELRERLRGEGVTLNQLHFEALERNDASAPVRATAEASNASFGQGGHEREGRREEAPPWPAPRTSRAARAPEAVATRRRGLDLSA